eukprot:6176471-Pleurochrysis_carterae.AAC.3
MDELLINWQVAVSKDKQDMAYRLACKAGVLKTLYARHALRSMPECMCMQAKLQRRKASPRSSRVGAACRKTSAFAKQQSESSLYSASRATCIARARLVQAASANASRPDANATCDATRPTRRAPTTMTD